MREGFFQTMLEVNYFQLEMGFFLYLNVSGVVDYAQLLDSAIAIGYV